MGISSIFRLNVLTGIQEPVLLHQPITQIYWSTILLEMAMPISSRQKQLVGLIISHLMEPVGLKKREFHLVML